MKIVHAGQRWNEVRSVSTKSEDIRTWRYGVLESDVRQFAPRHESMHDTQEGVWD